MCAGVLCSPITRRHPSRPVPSWAEDEWGYLLWSDSQVQGPRDLLLGPLLAGHTGSITSEGQAGQKFNFVAQGLAQELGRLQTPSPCRCCPILIPRFAPGRPLGKHTARWRLGACHPVSGFVSGDRTVNWPFMWGSGRICSGFPKRRRQRSPWHR